MNETEANKLIEKSTVIKVVANSHDVEIYLEDGTIISAYYTIHDRMEYSVSSE